jgi:hypothetical protein
MFGSETVTSPRQMPPQLPARRPAGSCGDSTRP